VSAELLREAAAKIRVLAEKATPGPWWLDSYVEDGELTITDEILAPQARLTLRAALTLYRSWGVSSRPRTLPTRRRGTQPLRSPSLSGWKARREIGRATSRRYLRT
jgi:hypothetical protein